MDKLWWVSIVAIFTSPLIVLMIDKWWTEREIKLRRREKLLEKLIALRHDPSNSEFISAVRSIPIVFRKYSKVRKLHRKLYQEAESQKMVEGKKGWDALTEVLSGQVLDKLILQICKELKYDEDIKKKDIHESFKAVMKNT